MRSALAPTLAAGLLLVSPRAAEACAGFGCGDPFVFGLSDGGTVPANAPALVLTPSIGAVLFRAEIADAGFELRANVVDAVPLTASIDGPSVLLRPGAPLAAGQRYLLVWPPLCGVSGASGRFSATFSASASQPLPTRLGTLAVTRGHGRLAVENSAECGGSLSGAWAQLAFEPDPALLPWLPLTRWSLSVDGQPWATEAVGAVRANGLLAPAALSSFSPIRFRRAFRVHAACGPATGDTTDRGLTLGKHTATLSAHVAGEAPLVLETELELSCDGPAGEPSRIIDGIDPQLPQPERGCGCTSAPGVALLCGLVLARRRRRASAREPAGHDAAAGSRYAATCFGTAGSSRSPRASTTEPTASTLRNSTPPPSHCT